MMGTARRISWDHAPIQREVEDAWVELGSPARMDLSAALFAHTHADGVWDHDGARVGHERHGKLYLLVGEAYASDDDEFWIAVTPEE